MFITRRTSKKKVLSYQCPPPASGTTLIPLKNKRKCVTVQILNNGLPFAHGENAEVFLCGNNANPFILKRLYVEEPKNKKRPFKKLQSETVKIIKKSFNTSSIKTIQEEYDILKKANPDLLEDLPPLLFYKNYFSKKFGFFNSKTLSIHIPMKPCLPIAELYKNLKNSPEIDHGNFELERYLIIKCLVSLQDLHKKYIIHSDIKPDNIMVRQGKIYLLDFGFSTVLDPYDTTADKTCLKGCTPQFADPQAYHPQRITLIDTDHRFTDIYALGISLEQLFKERPTGSGQYQQIIKNAIETMTDKDKEKRIQLRDNIENCHDKIGNNIDMKKMDDLFKSFSDKAIEEKYTLKKKHLEIHKAATLNRLRKAFVYFWRQGTSLLS